MGMCRGSHWKRAVIVPKNDTANRGERISQHFEAYGIDIEWWTRSRRGARTPTTEHWVMVRRGDWPMAHLLAQQITAEERQCL